MEEQRSPASASQTTSEEPWSEQLAAALAERRAKALQIVAAQQQQFDQIEAELDAHLAELEKRLAEGIADDDQQSRGDLDQLAVRLREQADELARAQEQLANDRVEIASRQAELQVAREQIAAQNKELTLAHREEIAALERRATELHAEEVKIKQAERTLHAAQDDHQAEVRQFASRRARNEEQQSRLERELEELERLREETRSQRRRIAQQFKIEHAALAHERELNRTEIERQRTLLQADLDRGQKQLREDRAALDEEIGRLRQQLRRDRAQLDDDIVAFDKTRRQWEDARRQVDVNRDTQSADLLAAQQEIIRLTTLLNSSQADVRDADARSARTSAIQSVGQQSLDASLEKTVQLQRQVAELQSERSLLSNRVAELEEQLAAAELRAEQAAQQAVDQPSSPAAAQQMEDLQRRFEMAVDDVRQLKRRNSELEDELNNLRSADRQAAPASSGGGHQDWETTKRRMLAQLEGEANDNVGGMSDDERLTVEGAIRITDGMVIERDREIAELKQRLAAVESTTTHADVIAAESATAEILDRDEMIQLERQRITALQDEWQEKLRQAEVDISVHRARIARERAELDEMRRALDAAKADEVFKDGGDPKSATGNSPGKPARRWLSRMGLKENE